MSEMPNFQSETKHLHHNTPLHIAAVNGHKLVARVLISKGAFIDAKNCENMTTLYAAM